MQLPIAVEEEAHLESPTSPDVSVSEEREEPLDFVELAPSVDDPFDLDAFELLLAADRAAAELPVASVDDVYGAEEEFTALEEASQARLPDAFAQTFAAAEPVPASTPMPSSQPAPIPVSSPTAISLDESASIGSSPKSSRALPSKKFKLWFVFRK